MVGYIAAFKNKINRIFFKKQNLKGSIEMQEDESLRLILMK